MRLTKAEKVMLRSVVLYVAEVPCVEFLETLSEKQQKILDRLVEKICEL